MSGGRSWRIGVLSGLIALQLSGGAVAAGSDTADASDVSPALLLAEDVPSTLGSAMGITHEPQFDYDIASFEANGGLDAAAQIWEAATMAPDDPVLIVFDFRFLFPDAEAAQAYLDAAESVLSEVSTGITLQSDTPPVGEVLRHYAGALSQGELTIDVHNFLFRVGPVVGKVYIAGMGTTLDDALPIAFAAGGRTEAWLVARPIPSAIPSPSATPATSPGPAGSELRQWASGATASSMYGTDAWSASRATGPPNVHAYNDDVDSWAPGGSDVGTQWLELTYDQAVVPTSVGVVESFGSGAVISVEAFDADTGEWVELWSGTGPEATGEIMTFSPPLSPVPFATDRIRVTLDTDAVPGYNEIDAVELVGTVP
jgi:hypothetical protein